LATEAVPRARALAELKDMIADAFPYVRDLIYRLEPGQK